MNKRIGVWVFLSFWFLCCLQAEAADKKMKENNSPFGVLEFLNWDHPWNNYKYSCKEDLEKVIALMKDAGAGWVRMDFLWHEIEPIEGKFNFDKYDQIVELLDKNNISLLGLLNYSVDWAASCKEWNCPPKDNQLFVNYAQAVVSRYKDKIKYWEVWNEPDSSTYWAQQDGLKSYAALLKEVYVALKKTDPDCQILNGGLAGGLASVNNLYDNGAGGYFDILNIHIFDSPLHPGAISRVAAYPKLAYKVMSRNGDAHKKIWVTETGCPGVKTGLKVNNWWIGDNPDEEQQAEWLKIVFRELLKEEHIERVFWAFFRDCNKHWDNGVDYLGLVRWDYSLKPAFSAYRKAAKM